VGSYSLTVFYAAANEPYKSVGVFDVFSPETGRVLTSVPMPRTAAEGQELTIQFDVTAPDAGQLEFRTFYEGEGTLTTWWVRITPL
jgi:hypothetical protein